MKTLATLVSALVVAHSCLAQASGTVLWRFPAARSVASPAIGADGTIYAPSEDGHLYALTPAGSNIWSFQTGGPIRSSPAVGDDGTIYFGCDDGKLYAINPDGTLKWTWPGSALEFRSSPAVAFDGTIYVGSGPFLYAVSPTGQTKWSLYLDLADWPQLQDNSPAIGADGTIYMCAHGVFAIRPNGTVKWVFRTENTFARYEPVAIGLDETLYVTGVESRSIYALKDGVELWRTNAVVADGFFLALGQTPAVGRDGTIYAVAWPSGGNSLVAFTPSGEQKWVAGGLPDRYVATPSPSVDERGGTYFAGKGNSYDPYYEHYAITSEGTTNFVVRAIYGPLFGSPTTIARDGTLYALGGNGLYAIKGTNGPANTGWPMHRQNARQTGKVEWPRLRSISRVGDNVRIEVFADPGWRCTLQTSSNLVDWLSITNFLATTNRTFFTDPLAGDATHKFYRAVSP